jgi:uncharacterized protein (DUF58 family)
MLAKFESQLKLLELKCRRPVEHLLAGEYRSVFRGRGVEFEDVRLYQPGDDVRTMDWKVTARTGEPHIKRFVEEREQFVYLLVDFSASMLQDADGRKRQTITEVCALLTLAAVKNQDRIGLLIFTDQIEHIVPPGKGRTHAMRIMDALLHFQPEGRGTNFSEMMGRFGHMARKHSILFVVSDFFAEDYARDLQSLAYRHDVNAIHLSEPQLMAANFSGLVRMQDAESGVQQTVDLGQASSQMQGHMEQLKQTMLESRVSLLDLPVGADCVEALAGFFHERQSLQLNESGHEA